jgi:hypothetical protein
MAGGGWCTAQPGGMLLAASRAVMVAAEEIIIHYLSSDTVRYRLIFKLKKNLKSTHKRE